MYYYICLKKDTYKGNVPDILKDRMGTTWEDGAMAGLLGNLEIAPNGSYYLVKGEFSMKEGELSAIANLGASMTYPNNSVLTNTEAIALIKSDVWLNG